MAASGLHIEIIDERNDVLTESLPIDEAVVRTVCQAIFTDAGITDGRLSVAVMDNDGIHNLNVQFLQHDYPTDVLSFVIDNDRENGILEGEVVVSEEMAQQRAAEFGWTPAAELMLYIIHGTLHLVGYDDLTERDSKMMRQKERKYLDLLNIKIPDTIP